MKKEYLINTAQSLVAQNKGILAMDESNPTITKRFETLGIESSPESRRKYREMLVTTPGLNESISGAILFDETVRQKLENGDSFIEALEKVGIIPGIKVDLGTQEIIGNPLEKSTFGLDDLEDRLSEYAEMGLKFAKWRAVFSIGDGIPSDKTIDQNAKDLAAYALACQKADLVPVVEPEVLMDGNHDLSKCKSATEKVLKRVFEELENHEVILEAIILKPNMIVPGSDHENEISADEIAEATVESLRNSVPESVPAIVFLSGGQSPLKATESLNAMNKKFQDDLPWTLSFSFSRALQNPALELWNGKEGKKEAAQKALFHRAMCNRGAVQGLYSQEMENLNPKFSATQEKQNLPGYPHYSASEDIFNREEEINVDIDDVTALESEVDTLKDRNPDEFYDELPEEKLKSPLPKNDGATEENENEDYS